MISTEDDYFHERSDDIRWNESGWFGFLVPERGFSGAVYTHHRPNRSYAWAGLVLWDLTGEQIYDCVWHDFTVHPFTDDDQRVGSSVFDYTTDSGLTVRMLQPMKAYRFTYDSPQCRADLTWQAFMEPHDSSGFQEGWEDWGSHHCEQGGRMTGEITVWGETITIDCLSGRDRSWGPHRQTKLGCGDFPWGFASESHGFIVHAVSTLDPDTDPFIGTAEPVGTGFYLKDGKVSTLVSGERTVPERGADGRPLVTVIDAVDKDGRELHAVGQTRNFLNFSTFSESFWWWGLTEWAFDGTTGWGEVLDFYSQQHSRRFIRSLKPKTALELPTVAGAV
jgi:hypothetical protein